MLKKIANIFNKGYSLVFFLSGIGAALSFLLSTLLAKFLGAAEYGEIQYYISVINTLSLFLQFGLPSFLVKTSQFAEDKNKFISNYFNIYNIISLFITPIFFLIAYFALDLLNKDLFLVFLIFLCSYLYSLSLIVINYLSGLTKFKLSTFLESVLPKIVILLFFLFVLITNNIRLLGDFYLYIFGASYLLICLPFFIKNFKFTKIHLNKKDFFTIMLLFAISITGSLNANISKVFQGEFFANEEILGIYSISMQIVNLGTLFCAVVTNISKPFFSKYSAEGNKTKLIEYYAKTVRLSCYIAVPFMMAFAFQAEKVLGIFGDSFLGAPIFLILSCVYGVLISITGPCGTLLAMAGKEKHDLISGIINCVSFVTFSLILKSFTIYAVPIAMIIAVVLSKTFSIVSICCIYKINPFPIKTLIYIAFIFLVSADIFFGLNSINSSGFWFLFNILFGSLIILFSFLLSPYKEDKYFFFKNES